MAEHKFSVGQTVEYSPGQRGMMAVAGSYKIMKLLPPENGQLLYRIKCGSEPYERVAQEPELSRR